VKRLLLHNRMTTGLSALCGLLTLILLAEITLLDTTDFDPDTSRDNIELPVGNSGRFIPKTLAYFTDILERPLLFEGRRMPPEPVAAAKPVKQKAPLRLKLEGIAISSDRRIALLRNTSDNQALQLIEGMSYKGWTLQELNTSGAKFLRGEDVTEIILETGLNPSPRRR
jgi:hypothetical protein